MSRLFWIATTFLLAIVATATAEPDSSQPDAQENFDKNIKPLTEGIGKAKELVLYEGLPHPFWEPDLLSQERQKKIVTLHGFAFYETSIKPKEDDWKKFSTICADLKTYQLYAGPKLCGGYHPDWCLEWKEGEDVYQVFICFGCHEAKLYGPKNKLYTDLDEEAYNQLKELLTTYRKNRPVPQEE